ncbi:single-stranded DNA-binding protein [Novosphingobium olei]|uniref:Single-stranded DNA-binding protein n=1 Tax=Novosphingobium olei TaxID=2728851 RepID=A0A7Y0BT62_9SPHN|nr:single-stranded DNA-binding protein [Novosphingobium olei]NML96092.1 single-stranded DNA-binding protein [Novosphingobium olei]
MKNSVTLAGFVGSNPEVRSTQGGASITSLSVATTRRFKDGEGNRQSETEWHRITCFNGVGKSVAEHVTKGALVMVTGRIHYTRWTDKNGQFRYGCEIIAEEVDFLGRAKEKAADDTELPLEVTAQSAPAKTTRRRSK